MTIRCCRKGVFETNSSSMHSVTVADNGGLKNNLACDEEGMIYVEGGEFGWEEAEYTDVYTKLSYLITFIFERYVDLRTREVTWRRFNPSKERYYWKKLQRVVENFTGCLLDIKMKEKNTFPMGYIDDQSREVAEALLDGTDGRLKRFIFNPKSVLKTDHDNHERQI